MFSKLLVIDRRTGETEQISLDDRNAAASVYGTAERLRISEHEAWEILQNGGELATFGFIRKLG